MGGIFPSIRSNKAFKKKSTYLKRKRTAKTGAGAGAALPGEKGRHLAGIAAKNNITIRQLKGEQPARGYPQGRAGNQDFDPQDGGDDDNDSVNGAKKSKKDPGAARTSKNDAGRKSGEKTYVVKKGDSLFGIARSHDMDISRLRDLNNINGKKQQIRAGQVLIVE